MASTRTRRAQTVARRAGRRGRPLLAFAVMALTGAQAAPPGGLQERAGVELVLVPVSIRDAAGAPIAGLTREDFTLYENGARQEIATFDREPTPVSIVFGVDTSGSMDQYLTFVKAAAIRFVERIPRVFAVSLVSFADVTTTRCEFSGDRRHLYYELDRLKANGGGTAILDATREAIATVARRPGRRAVVLFTDGEENSVAPEERRQAEEAVVRQARASGATVYYVGYGWVARPQMLERIATATGGVYLAAGRERRITEAFDAIARALDSQYTLGYVPRPGPPGEWRPIAVEVRRASVDVAARAGYLVPAPDPLIRP
jgi:Ca-activated chloride channel family protein